MRRSVCKLGGGARAGGAALGGLLVLQAILVLNASCNAGAVRLVRLEELDTGVETSPEADWQVRVGDPGAVVRHAQVLSRRLALVQVRDCREWERLRADAPQLGACPDLSAGIVVGLLFHAGTPLNGEWPLSLEGARMNDGAGLLEAHFTGGSYLADGAGYLHLAHIRGIRAVLVVEVDGARFFPQ